MDAIFSIIQVLIAIAMIAIILIQRGPGAAAGSGFGAGASGTVFGARGSGSFLTRTTALLAVGFFAVSMTMAVLASRTASSLAGPDLGVMGEAIDDAAPEVPNIDVPGIGDALEGDATDVPEMPGADLPEAVDEVPQVPAEQDETEPPGDG